MGKHTECAHGGLLSFANTCEVVIVIFSIFAGMRDKYRVYHSSQMSVNFLRQVVQMQQCGFGLLAVVVVLR